MLGRLKLKLKALVERRAHILALSSDVLALILDWLAPHDRYFLAQSCRALRRLLWRDWHAEVRRLSLLQRLEFLAGVASVLLDRYPCKKYLALHAVDESSTPRATVRSPSCCHSTNWLPMFYNIQHHHAQLALKYTRLGDTRQDYVRALMAPHTESWHSERRIYSAKPKIIGGRFILGDEWILHGRPGVADLDERDIFELGVAVCPHTTRGIMNTRHHRSRWQIPFENFESAISGAFNSVGTEVRGRCVHCPTDYSVQVSPAGVATFKAWHDYGTYGCPLDPEWLTVMWRVNKKLPSRHIPGSIRELYEKDSG